MLLAASQLGGLLLQDQKERLSKILKDSFLFAAMDSNEVAILIDAMQDGLPAKGWICCVLVAVVRVRPHGLHGFYWSK